MNVYDLSELGQAALGWAAAGYAVFPCVPRTKKPLTKQGSDGVDERWGATTDPEIIARRWSQWPDANIGAACGAASGGMWALDVDGDEGRTSLAELEAKYGALPTTMTVTSGREGGGDHRWFSGCVPELRNSASEIGKGLDVRGEGGFMVLPPSVHKSGVPYRLVDEQPPAAAPGWLFRLARKHGESLDQEPLPTPPPRQPSTVGNVWESGGGGDDRSRILGMIRPVCDKIRSTPEGKRNHTVNRVCYALGGLLHHGNLSIDDVARDLEAAAVDAGQPADMVRRSLADGTNHKRPMPSSDRLLRDVVGDPAPPADEEPPPPEPDDPFQERDDGPDVRALGRLPHTDLGNAERFRLRFGSDVRWCEVQGQWLAWNGRHWTWDLKRVAHYLAQETVRRIPDEARELEAELAELPAPDDCSTNERKRRKWLEERIKAIHAWAHASQGSRRIGAILVEARALKGIPVALEDLDARPHLLTVANGTLDLGTRKLRPSRREDLITRGLEVAYDPSARAPRWTALVERVLPVVEIRGLVQRAFGYALTGTNKAQKWFLFTGEGQNGKSTVLDAFRWLLGPYAARLPAKLLEEQKFEQHPAELMTLLGARVAVGSEPKRGSKWDGERIKSLTGDGTISAHAMRKDYVEFACTAVLFVSANDLPRVDDMGFGFWRRLVVVRFSVQIPDAEVDPDLGEKLKAEGPGILNWVLEGLRDYRQVQLAIPEACKAETTQYREQNDHVQRFVDECCDCTGGFATSTDDLYQAFRKWFEREGLSQQPPNKIQFGIALSGLKILVYEGHRKKSMRSGIRLLSSIRDKQTKDQAAPDDRDGGPDDWA